jgi:DNA-binding beta-propeller fold protein YncE
VKKMTGISGPDQQPDRAGVTLVRFTAVFAAYVLGASLALAQPQVEIEFIGGFGNTSDAWFYAPVGVFIDSEGRLLIADNENHQVQRCGTQGSCEIFASPGSTLGAFYWPVSVVEDSLGRIFVSEAGNDRVLVLDTAGGWHWFGSGFDLPAGMAVDDQDNIIIADENNDRVRICTSGGSCTSFGSHGSGLGQFSRPRAVTLDNQQRILVSDWDNHRIQNCDYSGNCTAFGSLGVAPGQFHYPCELVVDSQDHIIVTDRANHRIQICDLNGACTAYGQEGSGPGQFRSPTGVAVDDQNRIYVADRDNNRIQIFQATYAGDPASFQINPGLNDAWYNPATNGQGFLITVFPDIHQMFLAWFTFDTERPPEDVAALLGDPGQRWLTAQGPYDGDTANLTVFVTEGGVFDSATPAASTDPAGDGTLTLEFADCNAGLVTYAITSLGLEGEIPIQRISPDNLPLCESSNPSQLQAR